MHNSHRFNLYARRRAYNAIKMISRQEAQVMNSPEALAHLNANELGQVIKYNRSNTKIRLEAYRRLANMGSQGFRWLMLAFLRYEYHKQSLAIIAKILLSQPTGRAILQSKAKTLGFGRFQALLKNRVAQNFDFILPFLQNIYSEVRELAASHLLKIDFEPALYAIGDAEHFIRVDGLDISPKSRDTNILVDMLMNGTANQKHFAMKFSYLLKKAGVNTGDILSKNISIENSDDKSTNLSKELLDKLVYQNPLKAKSIMIKILKKGDFYMTLHVLHKVSNRYDDESQNIPIDIIWYAVKRLGDQLFEHKVLFFALAEHFLKQNYTLFLDLIKRYIEQLPLSYNSLDHFHALKQLLSRNGYNIRKIGIKPEVLEFFFANYGKPFHKTQ